MIEPVETLALSGRWLWILNKLKIERGISQMDLYLPIGCHLFYRWLSNFK